MVTQVRHFVGQERRKFSGGKLFQQHPWQNNRRPEQTANKGRSDCL